MAAKQSSISSPHSTSNSTQEHYNKKVELVAPQPQQHMNVSDDNNSFDPNHVVITDEKSNCSLPPSRNLDPCLNCGHYGIIQGQMIQDANNNTFCGPNCGWSYFLRPDERERAVQAAAMARMKSRSRRSRRRSSRNSKETTSQTDTQTETTNSTCQSTCSSKSESRRHKMKQTKSITELNDEWMDQTMMNSMFQYHLDLFNSQDSK